jgi:hypothetical protein
LTASTLTINAPASSAGTSGNPNSNGSAADGQRMRLRIKNTNSTSTVMTLAFGSVYDTSAFSVGTIAAGSKTYLDFTFDADNSKWDLTGLVSGI